MGPERIRCVSCGRPPEPDAMRPCVCGGSFEVHRARPAQPVSDAKARLGVWRYARALPRVSVGKRVSLDEGGTPLHRCHNLERQWGIHELYVKNEGLNPTGSFKDRGMTVAVSVAVREGFKRIACASTGNTAASAAAYARRAGLECVVYLPKGRVAPGKLVQVRVFGARLQEIGGSFDEALQRLLASRDSRTYLVNSLNPIRLEGQKTTAFEVWEQLGGRTPRELWLPVGNAGNIGAIWKGFDELVRARAAARRPRFVGVQAEGAAPLVRAWESRLASPPVEQNPRTVASAINIGRPASWDKALRAVRTTDGRMERVSDDEILAARRELARREGIFVEPASAAPLAALKRRCLRAAPKGPVVVVCTGHGLKDTASVSG